jgi:signal transduction histidine kinase
MSLTFRLTLTYLLITMAVVLLLGAGFVTLAGRYVAEQRQRELGAQASIYAALLGELAASPAALEGLAPASPGAELLPPGTAARLFSLDGAMLAGDPAFGPFPSRAALPLLSPPVPLPASQVSGRQYAAQAIAGASGPIGVVELSRDTAADARLLSALRALAIQAALVAATVAAVVSVLVARSIAGPVVRLTRRAEELAATLDQPPTLESGRRTLDEGRTQELAPPRDLSQQDGPLVGGPPLLSTRPSSPLGRLSSFVFRPSSSPPRPSRHAERPKNELAALASSLARLELGLRAYTTQIAELEQSRVRFYRGVSHELRTPLTAIRAGLENLADGAAPAVRAADAQGYREAITRLESEAARLSRLVDELLADRDRAAGGAFALTARAPLDLSALAAEVCALLQGRAERAGVSLACAGSPLELLGNRDRLKQALINLLDNALRVTPPGGTVLVATLQAGDRARLAVMDDGPGVDPALAERIWEAGQRGGDQSTNGSAGLGLAIVREIAAAHGGEAYLDERYGPGARFVIELPLPERSEQ